MLEHFDRSALSFVLERVNAGRLSIDHCQQLERVGIGSILSISVVVPLASPTSTTLLLLWLTFIEAILAKGFSRGFS